MKQVNKVKDGDFGTYNGEYEVQFSFKRIYFMTFSSISRFPH